MKVLGLISGGKDSIFNLMHCVANGHEIIALANLQPPQVDVEIDSMMYQTVASSLIETIAVCMDLPLFSRNLRTLHDKLERNPEWEDEVHDLYFLLLNAMKRVKIEAVSVGAILSSYQRVRVEQVCKELGLVPLSYLWQRDQTELMREMIECEMDCRIVKIAAMGLEKKHLGLSLKEIFPTLQHLYEKYGVHVCGEGGEFETITLDCPLFKKTIIVDDQTIVEHSDVAFAPVLYLNLKTHTTDKKSYGLSDELISKMKRQHLIEDQIFLPEDYLDIENTPIPSSFHIPSQTASYSVSNSVIFTRAVTLPIEFFKDFDVKEETKWILQEIQKILESSGFDIEHSAFFNLYVKNINDFQDINSVYQQFFKVDPPSRACIQVNLPEPFRVQIDCMGLKSDIERQALHVQGISYWAPANIGPYSQSITVISLFLNLYLIGGKDAVLAGQIGLIPGSMTMPNSLSTELVLIAKSIVSVLSAIKIKNIAVATIFVRNGGHLVYAADCWEKLTEHFSIKVGTSLYLCVDNLPKNALVEIQVHGCLEQPKIVKKNNYIKCETEQFDFQIAIDGFENLTIPAGGQLRVYFTPNCDMQKILEFASKHSQLAYVFVPVQFIRESFVGILTLVKPTQLDYESE